MSKKDGYCWVLVDGKLTETECPYDTEDGTDLNECLEAAGYREELSSKIEDSFGEAEVTLFKNIEPKNGKPLFYVDVWGDFHGIGAVVARDFGQLVETMNQLSGLIALLKLSQSAQISERVCTQLIPRP